jgi:hypothetical protein
MFCEYELRNGACQRVGTQDHSVKQLCIQLEEVMCLLDLAYQDSPSFNAEKLKMVLLNQYGHIQDKTNQ